MTAPAALSAEVHRRNVILGLILGGFVIAMIATWVLVFTRAGLPKDPELWQQMQKATTLPGASPAPSSSATPSVTK